MGLAIQAHNRQTDRQTDIA